MEASQREAIDQLLKFLPIFEDPGFVAATWPKRFYTNAEGKQVMNMPYPDYHPAVEEFRDQYRALVAGIQPYEPLPEDETQEGIPFSVMGATFTEEYFAKATIDQIRRYLMLLGRGERFSDGHIDGEFRAGKVVLALRRLAVLRGQG